MSRSGRRPSQLSGGGRKIYWILGVVERLSRMFGSGQESLSDVQERSEALLVVQEWSGDPPRCPGAVGRPFQMFGSGRETVPDV